MEKKKLILIGVCVLLAIVLIILLFFVLGKGDSNPIGEKMTYENYTILEGHTGELKSYDKSLYVEGYQGSYGEAYYIEGTLKSSEIEKQDFVVIRFNLYDKKGNVLGTAIAGLNDVEKDKEYKFKAMSLTTDENAKKVYKYDIKKIESK